MKKNRKLDLVVLALMLSFATVLALVLKTNYFESEFLFLGIPCLYLSLRAVSPALVLKIFVFSSIFSIPLGIFVDYLVTADKGWIVPSSVFPRLFGIVPLEDIIYAFLSTYLAIIFYEFLVDKGRNHIIERRLSYLAWLSAYVSILFLFAYYFFGENLALPYAFLVTGVVFFLTPLVFILLKYPRLLHKYIPVFLYFLLIAICFELTSLYLKQWEYLGTHYLGLLGAPPYVLPAEELIFFWFLWGPAILAYYEFFDDDRK